MKVMQEILQSELLRLKREMSNPKVKVIYVYRIVEGKRITILVNPLYHSITPWHHINPSYFKVAFVITKKPTANSNTATKAFELPTVEKRYLKTLAKENRTAYIYVDYNNKLFVCAAALHVRRILFKGRLCFIIKPN